MRSVLIVDDNAELASLLAIVADAYGLAPRLAHTGKDARRSLESMVPEAALVDLLLPDCKGQDLIAELSARGVVCMAMSGVFRGENFASEAMARGARAFVEKPFVAREVMAKLVYLLASPASPQAKPGPPPPPPEALRELSLEDAPAGGGEEEFLEELVPFDQQTRRIGPEVLAAAGISLHRIPEEDPFLEDAPYLDESEVTAPIGKALLDAAAKTGPSSDDPFEEDRQQTRVFSLAELARQSSGKAASAEPLPELAEADLEPLPPPPLSAKPAPAADSSTLALAVANAAAEPPVPAPPPPPADAVAEADLEEEIIAPSLQAPTPPPAPAEASAADERDLDEGIIVPSLISPAGAPPPAPAEPPSAPPSPLRAPASATSELPAPSAKESAPDAIVDTAPSRQARREGLALPEPVVADSTGPAPDPGAMPADVALPFSGRKVWHPSASGSAQEPRGSQGAPRSGSLASTTVPRLLTALYQGQQTGELRLRRGGVLKVIGVDRGVTVFAASNVGAERLGRFALRAGKLDAAKLEQVQKEVANSSSRTGDAMVALGLLTAEERRALVERQVQEIVWSTFDWRDGDYQFGLRASPRQEMLKISLAPAPLILEGYKRGFTLLRLRELMPADQRFLPTADPPYSLSELPLSDGEAMVLAHADGTKTVDDLVILSELDERSVRAVLCGLWQLGILEPRAQTASRSRVVLV